ncbi:peroxiredoxin [Peijinzhouia sedimentorum]
MALKVGDLAPDFTLPSTSGKEFKLREDMKGKALIIYFYPKDSTRVCTQEACEFRDHFEHLKDLDITVIGISRDSIQSHLDFKKLNNLPFELLSDKDGKVCGRYKALIPVVKMPKRITYLLDKDHKIKAAYSNLFGSSEHLKAMLDAIKQ